MTGTFALTPWDAKSTAILTATGLSLVEAMEAGLSGLIAAAREISGARQGASGSTERAVSIRADGVDGMTLFAALANDILAQLETYGTAFDRVELDGLIRTDDGLSAWGYLRGIPNQQARPVDVTLDGAPTIVTTGGCDMISCRLRRIDLAAKGSGPG